MHAVTFSKGYKCSIDMKGRTYWRLPWLAVIIVTVTACHRFDRRQVPVVDVGPGLRPVITWAPEPAYELSVYEGNLDGDGIGVLWMARGTGGFDNYLNSPVTYGIPPPGSHVRAAPPLEPGMTYTVSVRRADPAGRGDGFTARRHRYIGVKTFTATVD